MAFTRHPPLPFAFAPVPLRRNDEKKKKLENSRMILMKNWKVLFKLAKVLFGGKAEWVDEKRH